MHGNRFGRMGIALLIMLAARPAVAQNGSISGKITEASSGAGILAARIQIRSGPGVVGSTASRDDGTYRVSNLAPGTYTVHVTRIGFAEKRIDGQRVSAGANTTVDVQLTEVVTQLNPVVTSASRKEEKSLDAPAAVNVIDVRDIQERTSATVADQVQGVAGVDINKNGVVASNIVARGFNNAFSGSILMLQDYRFAGVPSLSVNVPFLFTTTNEDLERVEVLLGPASALYGPNSGHGVLHMITKSPFTSQGTTLTVDGGSQSMGRAAIRHAGLISPKVGYKLSGEYFTAKDWEFKDPAEPATFPSSAPSGRAGLPNTRDFDINRYVGEARLDIRPTENSEFVSTVGRTHIGSGIEYTGANGTAQVKNWNYTSLQQRARIGRLFGQVFANMSDAGNENASDLSGTFLLRSGQPIVDQSRVFAAQLQHGLALGTWQDFVYGLDYVKTEPRTGHTINGRNEDIDNVREVGGYVQSTTNLGRKFDFIAALRLDNNDQVEGNQFSPRVAFVYKPNEVNNFRVTFNRAFSTPSNFSLFLDLIQQQVPGTPYAIRALGNPPKTGWQFNRTCGGLCMRTIFTGPAGENEWLPATANIAYPGVIAGNAAALVAGLKPGIEAVLISQGVPASQAGPAAQQQATQLVAYLGSLRPTSAQVGTDIRYLGSTTNISESQVTDISPLKASFNNTYEVGYKGIIKNRLRVAVDAWTEKRGDVGNPAGLATPNVFFNKASLQGYLNGALVPALRAAGLSQPVAEAAAAQIAGSVSTSFAPLPLGIISFDSDKFASARDVYATYTSSTKEITVNGVDLAMDLVATNRLTVSGTYSWVSDLIFTDVTSSNSLPLMLNAPDNKASLGLKYRDEGKGWGWDIRGRYFNGYPVNSGVYRTDQQINLGSLSYRYESVFASALLDVGINKRFAVSGAQEFMWSLNADNILGHPYRTMPGAPRIGRMIMTRLQYNF